MSCTVDTCRVSVYSVDTKITPMKVSSIYWTFQPHLQCESSVKWTHVPQDACYTVYIWSTGNIFLKIFYQYTTESWHVSYTKRQFVQFTRHKENLGWEMSIWWVSSTYEAFLSYIGRCNYWTGRVHEMFLDGNNPSALLWSYIHAAKKCQCEKSMYVE